MKQFSRSFKCWDLSCNPHLNIMSIDSKGSNLDELLENAKMSLEDWNGNEGPEWDVGDLSKDDYDEVIAIFNEFLGEPEKASDGTET